MEATKAGEEEPLPYFVVHRLDRPVRGSMVLAKTKERQRQQSLGSKQIQEFEFEKNYQAVVCGNLKEDFAELLKIIF
ncbi:MAG: pseudouridine synthase [Anaerobutyricum sp.]